MLSQEDFQLFADLVKRTSGLLLSADKGYLLESRLGPVAREHGCKNLAALAHKLRSGQDRRLAEAITDAMTTNESFFFRDTRPFDQFRDLVLPTLLERRAAQRKLRIWSAAASSGQEAYSLAIILKEQAAKLAGWRVEILGTDISPSMIERAKQGHFSQFEVQRGLPITMLVKYFDQKGDQWQVKQELRNMVQFRTFNLLDNLSSLGQFDVVFCRNVLIYFDQETKARVLSAIRKQMPDDGVLYLGGAETVLGLCDQFKALPGERGLYVPSTCPADWAGAKRGKAATVAVPAARAAATG